MNAIALNKENVSHDPAPLAKNQEVSREFGRDVTNNAHADVNKNSFEVKDSQNTTDADFVFKNQSEEADAKEAKANVLGLHAFTKDVKGANCNKPSTEGIAAQKLANVGKAEDKTVAVEN